MKLKGILITVVVALTGIVIIQNTDVVGFNFLFWEIQMSRIILFPLLLGVGIIIGVFIRYLINNKRG
jgi:uncharacterized integral membrane protein